MEDKRKKPSKAASKSIQTAIVLLILLCVIPITWSYSKEMYMQDGKELHVYTINEAELPFNEPRNISINNSNNYTIELHTVIQQFISVNDYNLTLHPLYYNIFNYNITIPQNTTPGIYKSNITFFNTTHNISADYLFKFFIMQNDSIIHNATWDFQEYTKTFFSYTIYDIELPFSTNKSLYLHGAPNINVSVNCTAPIICSENYVMLNEDGLGGVEAYLEIDTGYPIGVYRANVTFKNENKTGVVVFEYVIKKAPVVIQEIEYDWNASFDNMTVDEIQEFFEWQSTLWQRKLAELAEANKTTIQYKNQTVEVGVPIIVDRAFTDKLLDIDTRLTQFVDETTGLLKEEKENREAITSENEALRISNANLRAELDSQKTKTELREEVLVELKEEAKEKNKSLKTLGIILGIIMLILIAGLWARKVMFGKAGILGW